MALDTFNSYLFVSSGEQSNKFLTPTYTDGIAQFQAQRAQSLTGLTVRIDPIQEGTGDPSPDNIRPISGRTGMTVTRAGKNLLPNAQGISASNNYQYFKDDGLTLKSGTYTAKIYSDVIPTIFYVRPFGQRPNDIARTTTGEMTFTLSEDTIVWFDAYWAGGTGKPSTAPNIQLEVGSTATAYEPYVGQTHPISWQTEADTVYGGTLDVVSGVLTVTDAQIASYAGETLPGEWISDRDVYAAGTTPTTGAQVVYKLATPQTYRLTGADVRTIAGFNQIYSDAGPVIDIKF